MIWRWRKGQSPKICNASINSAYQALNFNPNSCKLKIPLLYTNMMKNKSFLDQVQLMVNVVCMSIEININDALLGEK